MFLTLGDEQEFFRQTTARFLGEHVPVETLRRLRDDPVGFDRTYWERGADLGWTSLVVDEAHGGGSISGEGLVDLALVAYEFGRHAAPGPLAPTNLVAAALSGAAEDRWDPTIGELLAGTSVAAWCFDERRTGDPFGTVTLEARVEGDEVVLDGVKRPVESAAVADHLLVTGRTGAGLTQVLVAPDTPGVAIAPLHSVDLTRRFSVVAFDGVRLPATALVGAPAAAGAQVARQIQIALALAVAESLGALQTAFDMTVQWAFDRYSFGRPLASYQALKHRFADMKTWLEAGHAIGVAATRAVVEGSPEADELLGAAKAFVGDYGSELLHDCVQLHGGIGLTFDHDIHLYVRRHTVDRALYGTPAEHRQHLADVVEAREAA